MAQMEEDWDRPATPPGEESFWSVKTRFVRGGSDAEWRGLTIFNNNWKPLNVQLALPR